MKALSVLCAVVGFGCGSVVGPTADGDFTLALSKSAVTLPIGNAETLSVVVTRTGSIADITLSAVGVPTGVTVVFGQNPLPAGATSTEATITFGPGTVAGDSEISITGTADGLSHSAPVALTAQTITVSGRINARRANVVVRIPGVASTLTDFTGAFTIAGVTPPYDIYTFTSIAAAAGTPATPTVYYYEKLMRPDPVLRVGAPISAVVSATKSATVHASKQGGSTLATDPVAILFSEGGGVATAPDTAGSYTFNAQWLSGTTQAGTLYGLQWRRGASGAPIAFLGYGAVPMTLTASQDSYVSLPFSQVSTAQLTGSITPPAGYPVPSIQLTQKLGNSSYVLWSTRTTDATAMIPVIAAGASSLYAMTSSNGASVEVVHPALAGVTDVSFAMPSPATLTSPVIATGAPIEFDAPTGAVYQIKITTTGAQPYAFNLVTTETTTTMPSIPEVAMPSAQTCTWQVLGYGPVATIDDAATADGMTDVDAKDFAGVRHFASASATRTFTSQ